MSRGLIDVRVISTLCRGKICKTSILRECYTKLMNRINTPQCSPQVLVSSHRLSGCANTCSTPNAQYPSHVQNNIDHCKRCKSRCKIVGFNVHTVTLLVYGGNDETRLVEEEILRTPVWYAVDDKVPSLHTMDNLTDDYGCESSVWTNR